MDIYEIEEKLSQKISATRFSNLMSIALVDNFGLKKETVDCPVYLTEKEYLRYPPVGLIRPLEERLRRPPKNLHEVRYLQEKLMERHIEPKDYAVRTKLGPDPYKENYGEHVVIFVHHNSLNDFENKTHSLKENSVEIVSRSPLGFPEEVLKKENVTKNYIGLKPVDVFFFRPIQIIDKIKGKSQEKMLHNFM